MSGHVFLCVCAQFLSVCLCLGHQWRRDCTKTCWTNELENDWSTLLLGFDTWLIFSTGIKHAYVYMWTGGGSEASNPSASKSASQSVRQLVIQTTTEANWSRKESRQASQADRQLGCSVGWRTMSRNKLIIRPFFDYLSLHRTTAPKLVYKTVDR